MRASQRERERKEKEGEREGEYARTHMRVYAPGRAVPSVCRVCYNTFSPSSSQHRHRRRSPSRSILPASPLPCSGPPPRPPALLRPGRPSSLSLVPPLPFLLLRLRSTPSTCLVLSRSLTSRPSCERAVYAAREACARAHRYAPADRTTIEREVLDGFRAQ